MKRIRTFIPMSHLSYTVSIWGSQNKKAVEIQRKHPLYSEVPNLQLQQGARPSNKIVCPSDQTAIISASQRNLQSLQKCICLSMTFYFVQSHRVRKMLENAKPEGTMFLSHQAPCSLDAYLCSIDHFQAMAPHSSTLPGKSHGRRSLLHCSPWGR